jgi:peptidylprolyl isomerase domain and WD repeat-containing protein 1
LELTFELRTDFIITTSVDGHIKLWKKQDVGIEFVKDYRAHLTAITAVAATQDGQLFVSMADDGSAKIFDVVNFGKHPMLSAFEFGFSRSDFRHDQYDQTRLHTLSMLLGSS